MRTGDLRNHTLPVYDVGREKSGTVERIVNDDL
jgi:hypothetical protein